MSTTMRRFLFIMASGLAIAVPAQWALSQVTWIPDAWCYTTSSCDGVSLSGECEAYGFFVVDAGCASSNTCGWSFHAECLWNPGYECSLGTAQYISTDCGGECKLVSYNLAACMCEDKGIDTCEAGEMGWCWSRESCP